MVGRRTILTAAVLGALVLGGCGSDEGGSDAGDDTSSVTAAPTAETEAPGDDATSATEAADAGSEDAGSDNAGSGDVVGNPALFALTKLTTEEICALLPKDQVEAIVGVAVDEGTGMNVEGLGTNCLYYATGDFNLVAKLEFSVLTWETVVGLTSFTPEGAPAAEECTVAGKTAFCTPEYELEAGGAFGAQVYVKLGDDGDIVLFAESSLGVAQATQLAEAALANFAV